MQRECAPPGREQERENKVNIENGKELTGTEDRLAARKWGCGGCEGEGVKTFGPAVVE